MPTFVLQASLAYLSPFVMVDHYQVLEVSRQATAAEIKAAYKRLAMKFHPDHNPNNSFAEDYFKKVNEAYRILGNSDKKYLYDLGLAIPTPAQTSTQYAQQTETYTPPMSDEPYKHRYDPDEMVSSNMRRNIWIGTGIFGVLMVFLGFWVYHYLNERSLRIYLKEADALAKENEPRQALIKIYHALEHVPHAVEAHTLRAKIHIQMHNYVRAAEDYDEILQHHSFPKAEDLARIYFKRGWCHYHAFDFESALKDFEFALKKSPNNKQYHFFKVASIIKNAGKRNETLCQEVAQARKEGIKEADELMRIYCAQK